MPGPHWVRFRVNDNAHYPSQVMLGWWLAYLSASAVAMSDEGEASGE